MYAQFFLIIFDLFDLFDLTCIYRTVTKVWINVQLRFLFYNLKSSKFMKDKALIWLVVLLVVLLVVKLVVINIILLMIIIL